MWIVLVVLNPLQNGIHIRLVYDTVATDIRQALTRIQYAIKVQIEVGITQSGKRQADRHRHNLNR